MFRRNRIIRTKILSYLEAAREVLRDFEAHLDYFLHNGLDAHFAALVTDIHVKESRADDIRHEIEVDLFERSLLPESREDIFVLLEKLDALPNMAEDVLQHLKTEKLMLPDFIHDELRELVHQAVEAMAAVADGVQAALGDTRNIAEIAERIGRAETVGDQLEDRIVGHLFDSELPTADKILCRDVVREIGSLCDLADNVGTLIEIIAVKRHV